MAGVNVKVVHVTTLHPTFDIRIFHKECRTLAEAEYDVTLIAPAESDQTVNGVKVVAIARNQNRLLRMVFGGAEAYGLVRKLMAKERNTAAQMPPPLVRTRWIVHFHDPELLPWMALLRRRTRVVYDVHEDLAKSVLTKGWVPRALRPLLARFSRWTERNDSRRMHLVLAEDSYAKDYNWAPATTVLNLPRVDDLLQISEPKHVQPTVAYFGAVNASRGSLTTLRALGRLKAKGLDVAFECVGHASDAHHTELTQTAASLGVKLDAPGYTSAEEGWHMVAQCHLGLALLHPLPNYTDSYPTKIFEYMALGLPVIASNFPLYRDVIETNGCGICVDPLDEQAIAEAIRQIVENPAQAEAMARRGRETAKRCYNWETEADKLLSLYSQLSAANTRR
jgi:glycosyltransferase involved in cell wall biosynthesis